MNAKSVRFLMQIGVVGLIMIVLTIFIRRFIPMWITPFWSLLILFFVIICIVMYFLVERVKARDMRKFSNFFMAATMIKLVLYLIIILTYSLKFTADAKPFMLTFLAYYLVFTTFETVKLSKKDKNSTKK